MTSSVGDRGWCQPKDDDRGRGVMSLLIKRSPSETGYFPLVLDKLNKIKKLPSEEFQMRGGG